jgi:hypothetical protein
MKTQEWKMEQGGWPARSVLKCGDLSPLRVPAPGNQSSGTQSCDESQHFKTWRLRLACFCFLLSTFCFVAWGQYAVDWSTIDGGGGTSTGGVYSVSGTIGQPDAGQMSGGQFTLVSGFWSIIAVIQTPGAPTLHIYHTNGVVTVAWQKTAEGWVLEHTNALPSVTVPWPPVPGPYLSNSADFFMTTNAPVGNAFFRLHRP